MDYVKYDNSQLDPIPDLDEENVVPVLVSAAFLKAN